MAGSAIVAAWAAVAARTHDTNAQMHVNFGIMSTSCGPSSLAAAIWRLAKIVRGVLKEIKAFARVRIDAARKLDGDGASAFECYGRLFLTGTGFAARSHDHATPQREGTGEDEIRGPAPRHFQWCAGNREVDLVDLIAFSRCDDSAADAHYSARHARSTLLRLESAIVENCTDVESAIRERDDRTSNAGGDGDAAGFYTRDQRLCVDGGWKSHSTHQ